MQLQFGATRSIPEGVTTAWGARLIWPDDLLHDRQDLSGENTELLRAWLNGVPSGQGALHEALIKARALAHDHELEWSEDRTVTLYEDKDGIVVGNPQGSHGYLYVAAWMKDEAGV